MNRRGKLLALSTAAVGIVVLAVAGFVAKDWVREKYYFHKLKNGDLREQEIAAAQLATMGTAAVAQKLICVFEDDLYGHEYGKAQYAHHHSKEPIAKALAQIGPVAVLPLRLALKSEDGHTRCMAAHVLGAIGPPANSSVPDLIEAIADRRGIDFSVAIALGSIGPAAWDAVPYLIELLKNENWRHGGFHDIFFNVHHAVVFALRQILKDQNASKL